MWCLLIVAVLLTGCSQTSEPATKVEKEIQTKEKEFVLLADCEAPVWNEVFAVITWGKDAFAVDWGVSKEEDCWWFEEHSSFPGFDHPMLVIGKVGEGETLSVQTSYGEYEYEVVSRQEAWYNENLGNATDGNGESLINWGVSDELLFVLDRETHELYCARKTDGVEILREEAR